MEWVFLTVPKEGAKEQKYYLDYYGKGSVKKKAVEFFMSISEQNMKRPVIVAMLTELFKSDLATIKNELILKEAPKEVSVYTPVRVALKAFYGYKELQRKEGTISKTSMYGYKHHQRKLELYFKLPKYNKLTIAELNPEFWLNYRIDLLNNTQNFGKCLNLACLRDKSN